MRVLRAAQAVAALAAPAAAASFLGGPAQENCAPCLAIANKVFGSDCSDVVCAIHAFAARRDAIMATDVGQQQMMGIYGCAREHRCDLQRANNEARKLGFSLGFEPAQDTDSAHDTNCSLAPDAELRAARARPWKPRPLPELLREAGGDEDGISPMARVVYAVRGRRLYRRLFPTLYGDPLSPDPGQLADMEGNFRRVEALLWDTLQTLPDVPDADLVLLAQDLATLEPDSVFSAGFCNDFPCFTFSTKRAGPVDFVGFPNPYFLCSIKREADDVRWAERQPKVFWAGSLSVPDSAHGAGASAWKELPRVRLAELLRERPDILDGGFTGVDFSLNNKSEAAFLRRAYNATRHVAQQDFFEVGPKHKYLLSVDGVTVAWRAADLLADGGVLLLEDADQGEFFYRDLRPWRDYVPVSRNLSDLQASVSLLRQQDAKAQAIAAAGVAFRRQRLSLGQTRCWAREALRFMADTGPRPLLAAEVLLHSHGYEEVHMRPDFDAERCADRWAVEADAALQTQLGSIHL